MCYTGSDQEACAVTAAALAALTVTRDVAGYERWWRETAVNRDAIIEALECVVEAGPGDVEYALHGLFLDVFQGNSAAVEWLRVSGLRSGSEVRSMSLDVDVAHDGEGVLDGAYVVFHLGVCSPEYSWLRISVYTDHVRAVLASRAADDPAIALAKIVDAALVLINQDIADRDRFLAARAAAPVASGDVQSTNMDHGDPVTVEVWPSAIDEATVVQVDSSEGVGRLRINVNDGAVYDGDPDSDDPPGRFFQLGE